MASLLGYAVREIEDVRFLVNFRSERPDFDSDSVIEIEGHALWPLRLGVESKLATDETDQTELASIRAQIPVLIERANVAEGHPMDTVHVLFLDGSIVELPFGLKFPATQEFLDVLFNSKEN